VQCRHDYGDGDVEVELTAAASGGPTSGVRSESAEPSSGFLVLLFWWNSRKYNIDDIPRSFFARKVSWGAVVFDRNTPSDPQFYQHIAQRVVRSEVGFLVSCSLRRVCSLTLLRHSNG
jgi:hypothetical protein